jgi:hypothetical protein
LQVWTGRCWSSARWSRPSSPWSFDFFWCICEYAWWYNIPFILLITFCIDSLCRSQRRRATTLTLTLRPRPLLSRPLILRALLRLLRCDMDESYLFADCVHFINTISPLTLHTGRVRGLQFHQWRVPRELDVIAVPAFCVEFLCFDMLVINMFQSIDNMLVNNNNSNSLNININTF